MYILEVVNETVSVRFTLSYPVATMFYNIYRLTEKENCEYFDILEYFCSSCLIWTIFTEVKAISRLLHFFRVTRLAPASASTTLEAIGK